MSLCAGAHGKAWEHIMLLFTLGGNFGCHCVSEFYVGFLVEYGILLIGFRKEKHDRFAVRLLVLRRV